MRRSCATQFCNSRKTLTVNVEAHRWIRKNRASAAVYTSRHSRDHQQLFLAKFDDADHLRCYRRIETVVPQQALALANSRITRVHGDAIANIVSKSLSKSESDVEFAVNATALILGRQPTPKELRVIARFRTRWYEENSVQANESRTPSTEATSTTDSDGIAISTLARPCPHQPQRLYYDSMRDRLMGGTRKKSRTNLYDRRTVLRQLGSSLLGGAAISHGLGPIALQSLLAEEHSSASPSEDRRPHFVPKAKRVIWLFMRGGVSHLESFDPKPTLNRLAGKTIAETPFADVQNPEYLKRVRVVVVNDANGQQRNTLYPLQVGFKKYGSSGIEVSDWFPHIGSKIDDIAVIRSMWTTDDNHGAQVEFHTGRHMLDPRVPTVGAWINFGLGTLNENLPQFISMGPRFFDIRDGHYLGPAYDSIPMKIDPKQPLDFVSPHGNISADEQRLGFDLIGELNQLAMRQYPEDKNLAARIKSYELAYRMQTSVPNVIRFETETEATQKLYGFDQKETRPFGEQLLAARRFIEQGVRFVQILHGDGAAGAWDQHSGLKKNHGSPCYAGRSTDRGTIDRSQTTRAARRYTRRVCHRVRSDTWLTERGWP